MAADFPNSVKNFLTLVDGVDKVVAQHPNDRAVEITAIQTMLGGMGATQVNNDSYANLLREYRSGCNLVFDTVAQTTLEAGEIVCTDASGNKRFRRNTSNVTVTWADIDTGAEANDTYYIYAVADASGTNFTALISLNDTTPTGATFFKRLGSFVNSAGDIEELSITNDNLLGPGTVKQVQLKTALASISTAALGTVLTMTGGTYSFFPQIKSSSGVSHQAIATIMTSHDGNDTGSGFSWPTSFTTTLILGSAGGQTITAQNRYITSSGFDHWIFILIDKNTKEILISSEAPDHPSYGNGGDAEKVPHPFGSYDSSQHKIILISKSKSNDLKSESKFTGRNILDLINEEYKISDEDLPYDPLHSGKFLGSEPVMINSIPDYIKVRSLEVLTEGEKNSRKNNQLAKLNQYNEQRIKTKSNKKNALNKLKVMAGLTDNEVEALNG